MRLQVEEPRPPKAPARPQLPAADSLALRVRADEVLAVGCALAVTAGGALRSFKTTPLLTVDQGMTMMKKAASVREKYTPPLTISLVGHEAKAR